MYDMLPFPMIVGKTPEERISDVINYLIQFKETLEFILTNISTDNLSNELVSKLNSLGLQIEKNNQNIEEQMQRGTGKTLTVSDVINSDAFKEAIEQSVEFTVNYETGELEYTRT